MQVQATFDKRIHILCSRCGLEDMVGFSPNHDEAFLEFMTRYDKGQTATQDGISDDTGTDVAIRSKSEVESMIGDNKPDMITRQILLSRQDYLAQYRVLTNPKLRIGCAITDLELDDSIVQHVKSLQIERLYEFQEEAVRRVMSGESIVIEAPTASGKTEAFMIPVIQKMIKEFGVDGINNNNNNDDDDDDDDRGVFAILIYPTKALSRDQYPKIEEFAQTAGARVGVFDGDTNQMDRGKILENPPEIIITNFDVIHYHLWNKTEFSLLLGTVRMVVIDEVHTYSGIFGSNVHYVIKRLKRICSNKLQFVAASATLNNAEDFCSELVGDRMRRVCGTGRKNKMNFAMLFPVYHTQKASMIEIVKRMTDQKHKTMIFNNSHRNSELLAIQARRHGMKIMVHRAGLTARHRSNVEKQFKNGTLRAISCTPTLELGIDIGSVDCVISSTIPANRLIQRIGRAARDGRDGYAFLVLGNDPISQYYRNHPDDYFDDIEQMYIDPDNPFVKEAHTLAMACDKPITGDELQEYCQEIQKHVDDGNIILISDDDSDDGGKNNYELIPNIYKAKAILGSHSIRGIGRSIDIIMNGRKVADRELPIALEELYPGAIYFLAGTIYEVKQIGYPMSNFATIAKVSNNHKYYTRPLTKQYPTVKSVLHSRMAYGIEIAFCNLLIKKRVDGYVNMQLGPDTMQGEPVALKRPLEYELVTKGVVFRAPRPDDTITNFPHERGTKYVEAGGYHATEHVMIEGSNMITGGASQDMGGISLSPSGLIHIYDGAAGGSGASKALYDRFERVVQRGRAIIRECPCKNESGCPRCSFSYRCGNNNDYLHKRAALEILERICEGQTMDLADLYISDEV